MNEEDIQDDGAAFDAEDDDAYVIEDTGEELSDFDLNEAAQAVENVESLHSAARAASAAALGDLEEENRKLKDQFLRKLAEFDNYRKRTEREKKEYFRIALGEFLKELLPVLDNFQRALASDTTENEEFKRGIELIYKQFSDTLQKAGLTEIGEMNVHFDPNFHEAVMREENPDVPSHTVTEVFQKGYFLNDRLLRPAMVKVAVGGPDHPDEDGESD